MNKISNLLIFLLFLVPTLSTAVTKSSLKSKLPWVTTLSGGPIWYNSNRTQTFNLSPDVEKTYFTNNNTNVVPYGEVFFGLRKILTRNLQSQFGLALAASGNQRLSGEIWDDADPKFNNYNYNYKIQSTRIAFKAKLLTDIGHKLLPWISGSIGIGFNHAYSFQNTPTIYEAVPNANFTSRTQASFAYSLGIGIQKAINTHWQIGLGYEFADWGKSQLGRSSGQTLNHGLTLDHLYSNACLFNLTYLA